LLKAQIDAMALAMPAATVNTAAATAASTA